MTWNGSNESRKLRTDAVGAIRLGKGMLVSTEARPEARSHIADVSEPVSRLTRAQTLHDQLGQLPQRHQAQDAGTDQTQVADARFWWRRWNFPGA